MAEKIPSPSKVKTSSTTFSKEELEEIKILQEAISSITYKFGQFNLSKIRLEKQEQLLKDELSKLETKEFNKLIGDILYHVIIAQSEDGSVESDNRENYPQ